MLQEKLAQYFLPIVCVVLMAFVAALGGAGFGWSQGVGSEQRKLAKERKLMTDANNAATKAEAEWKGKVDAENAKFKEAAMNLAAARSWIDQMGEDTRVEIKKVASNDRPCVSPATARVLNAAVTKANQRLAEARDPGRVVAAVSTTAVIPLAVPDSEHIGLPRGLSEQETAEYINDTISAFHQGAAAHDQLIAKLRGSSMVKVIPGNRSF